MKIRCQRKKMPEQFIKDIKIFSDESDKEHSDKEIYNKENSDEENSDE